MTCISLILKLKKWIYPLSIDNVCLLFLSGILRTTSLFTISIFHPKVFQGILAMLSAILGEQFFMECYYPLGEVFVKVWQLLRLFKFDFRAKGDGLARPRQQCGKLSSLLHHVDTGEPSPSPQFFLASRQFRKTIRKMLGIEKRNPTSTSVTVTTKLEVKHCQRHNGPMVLKL